MADVKMLMTGGILYRRFIWSLKIRINSYISFVNLTLNYLTGARLNQWLSEGVKLQDDSKEEKASSATLSHCLPVDCDLVFVCVKLIALNYYSFLENYPTLDL